VVAVPGVFEQFAELASLLDAVVPAGR
jgi:hypothetical protein